MFLLYAQEFKKDLDQQTDRLPWSDHIFYNKHRSWSTKHLTKVLYQETAIWIELKLEILDYQHVVISIGCKYIGPGFIQELKVSNAIEEEGTDILEVQVETVFNL